MQYKYIGHTQALKNENKVVYVISRSLNFLKSMAN